MRQSTNRLPLQTEKITKRTLKENNMNTLRDYLNDLLNEYEKRAEKEADKEAVKMDLVEEYLVYITNRLIGA
jgi:hypothetical protein